MLTAYGDHFYALLCQGLGSGLGDITGDAADGEAGVEIGVGQDVLDDRTALVACGAKDCDDLRHFSKGCFRY